MELTEDKLKAHRLAQVCFTSCVSDVTSPPGAQSHSLINTSDMCPLFLS